MKGKSPTDDGIIAYQSAMCDDKPDELHLHLAISSNGWPTDIHLTRCTKANVVSLYDKWLNGGCEIVRPLAEYEYEFHPMLYAITLTHLYIRSENEGEFYKVPTSACEGFDRIGIMYINGKTFLVFDELMLYIETTPSVLQQYGIELVSTIE